MSKNVGITIGIALLVTGNLIGAGILAIPIVCGLVGVIPSIVVMIVFMFAMYYSAIVLADETISAEDEVFNYPSLYEKYLGVAGKWIAIAANMLILYGLLIAYLAGGTIIITELYDFGVSQKVVLVVFFLLMTLLTIKGIELVKKCNTLLIILLWGSFIIIVLIAANHIVPSHFKNINIVMLPVIAPILLTSFHFHNIIPNICKNTGWNKKIVYRAMLIGMMIGFLLNVIWLIVGVGVLPLNQGDSSINYAYIHNLPVIMPMVSIVGTHAILVFALIFAIIAIVTSYFANGLGLMGFTRDLLANYFNTKSQLLKFAVTFLPPLIIAMFYPDIFLKAINIVGGIGIVVLFGILPSIISLIKPERKLLFKLLSVIMLVLFTSVFIYQISVKVGFVKLRPLHMVPSYAEPGPLNILKY